MIHLASRYLHFWARERRREMMSWFRLHVGGSAHKGSCHPPQSSSVIGEKAFPFRMSWCTSICKLDFWQKFDYYTTLGCLQYGEVASHDICSNIFAPGRWTWVITEAYGLESEKFIHADLFKLACSSWINREASRIKFKYSNFCRNNFQQIDLSVIENHFPGTILVFKLL